MCVCSLIYLACNAYVPHCHLWPAWLYHIFPHLMNSTIFWRKLLNIKFVFWFSLRVLSRTYSFLEKLSDIVNVHRPSCKVPVICQILMRLEYSQQIFKKYSNIKFHANPELFHAGRWMDRQEWWSYYWLVEILQMHLNLFCSQGRLGWRKMK